MDKKTQIAAITIIVVIVLVVIYLYYKNSSLTTMVSQLKSDFNIVTLKHHNLHQKQVDVLKSIATSANDQNNRVRINPEPQIHPIPPRPQPSQNQPRPPPVHAQPRSTPPRDNQRAPVERRSSQRNKEEDEDELLAAEFGSDEDEDSLDTEEELPIAPPVRKKAPSKPKRSRIKATPAQAGASNDRMASTKAEALRLQREAEEED